MESYAGIGSRNTPKRVLALMEGIGRQMAKDNIILHSGNALGADQAFARGANSVDPSLVVLWLPWPNFEEDAVVEGNIIHKQPTYEGMDIAAMLHPAWDKLSRGARSLQGRNSHIILNKDVFTPVDQIICWTKDAKVAGGTGQGLRLMEWWNNMQEKGKTIKLTNLGERYAS